MHHCCEIVATCCRVLPVCVTPKIREFAPLSRLLLWFFLSRFFVYGVLLSTADASVALNHRQDHVYHTKGMRAVCAL